MAHILTAVQILAMDLILFCLLLLLLVVVVEAHRVAERLQLVDLVAVERVITTETHPLPGQVELLVKVMLVALVVQVTDSVLVPAVVAEAELVELVVTLAHKMSAPVVVAA